MTKKLFSLIELLVVVAVIAILFGLLAPALNKARLRGFTSHCQGNLKQIGVLIQNYALDSAGVYPNAGDVCTWGDGNGWVNLIANDGGTQKNFFRCPREYELHRFSYSLNCTEPYWKNNNNFCSWRSQDFDKAKIPPSQVVIVEETGKWSSNDDCDIDNYTQDTFCSDMSRHGNATMLLVDGHVEPVRLFDAGRMSYYTFVMSAWLPTLPPSP